MSDAPEVSFSSMDAASLLRWVRSDATVALGSEVNRWLRLIDVSSANSVRSRNPSERADFRETALLALEQAQLVGALPRFEAVRRNLSLRTKYMLQGNFDESWLRREASSILELFSNSIPIGYTDASRLVEQRRDRASWIATDPEKRKSLDQAIELLKPIGQILIFLDTRDRVAIEPWMSLLSKYMAKK